VVKDVGFGVLDQAAVAVRLEEFRHSSGRNLDYRKPVFEQLCHLAAYRHACGDLRSCYICSEPDNNSIITIGRGNIRPNCRPSSKIRIEIVRGPRRVCRNGVGGGEWDKCSFSSRTAIVLSFCRSFRSLCPYSTSSLYAMMSVPGIEKMPTTIMSQADVSAPVVL